MHVQSPGMAHARLHTRADVNLFFFFFNDTATTEIYTLSLHDALPIWIAAVCRGSPLSTPTWTSPARPEAGVQAARSEEHTSELQSQSNLVCRLLLEKKKKSTPLDILPCGEHVEIGMNIWHTSPLRNGA